MEVQSILIILLAVLVAVLATLLTVRIFRERRLTALKRQLNPSQVADLLHTTTSGAGIQQVARKLSDLLKQTFQCDVIIFLRRRRDGLELSFYHGLQRVDRQTFRIGINRGLLDLLHRGFLPRRLEELRDGIPAAAFDRLRAAGAELFFPIYWQGNLFGVYFIRSNLKADSPEFAALVAGLAHTLASAYHLRRRENRIEYLQNRLRSGAVDLRGKQSADRQISARLLKLVRHRESHQLMPRILGAVKQEMGFDRLVYVYRSADRIERLLIAKEESESEVPVPAGDVFDAMLSALTGTRSRDLSELPGGNGAVAEWANQVKAAGLSHAVAFSLAANRPGVLVWSGRKNDEATVTRLDWLRGHLSVLAENAEAYERLQEMSYTDNLTGLANRRYFSKRLHEEIKRASRYSRQLALIMFDLDGLKGINDRFGHLAGDAVLRQVGRILQDNIRSIDIVARYGGDEFCIIMPESDAEMCRQFMDRLADEVSHWNFVLEGHAESVSCSISQGAAVFPGHGDNSEALMREADMALLRAKEAGRGRSLLQAHSG